MMKYTNYHKTMMADLITPLEAYLKLRDTYPIVLLLESSDYSSKEDSKSYLCFDSLSTFRVDSDSSNTSASAIKELTQYLDGFEGTGTSVADGVFGYTAFDAIDDLDQLPFDRSDAQVSYPLIRYDFFRYVVIFDHFTNQLTVQEHCPTGESSEIEKVARLLKIQDYHTHKFSLNGTESSNMSDQDYMDLVTKAKSHCQRGDVFQMVLSRQFTQEFKGDDINVYRALRSINPSPYLFYFDYGSYKIFGSSPEAQLKVEKGIAEIHPIAGTFKRTQDPIKDAILAKSLSEDPKETAEHVMLVDLARNDLSKSCHDVEVTAYKQVQYFSHVIHLTSVVQGKIKEGVSSYQIFADTFPAGTLSGAPKYKAMELIRSYEPTPRGYYGGGIGMIGFDGSFNHAIIIRSFLSQNNQLTYQAGAGLVISSKEQSEMEEVKNKLMALNKAIELAQTI